MNRITNNYLMPRDQEGRFLLGQSLITKIGIDGSLASDRDSADVTNSWMAGKNVLTNPDTTGVRNNRYRILVAGDNPVAMAEEVMRRIVMEE